MNVSIDQFRREHCDAHLELDHVCPSDSRLGVNKEERLKVRRGEMSTFLSIETIGCVGSLGQDSRCPTATPRQPVNANTSWFRLHTSNAPSFLSLHLPLTFPTSSPNRFGLSPTSPKPRPSAIPRRPRESSRAVQFPRPVSHLTLRSVANKPKGYLHGPCTRLGMCERPGPTALTAAKAIKQDSQL